MGVAVIANTLYIVGGKTSPTLDAQVPNQVLAYSGASDTWQISPDPPVALGANIGCASVGQFIYIFGGNVLNEISHQALTFQAVYTVLIPMVK